MGTILESRKLTELTGAMTPVGRGSFFESRPGGRSRVLSMRVGAAGCLVSTTCGSVDAMQARAAYHVPFWLGLHGVLGCGGGAQSIPAEVKSSDTPANSNLDGGSGRTVDPGSGTTTTELADGGYGLPTQLAERSPLPESSSSGAPAAVAHAREPGRGIADIRALVVAHRDEARACYEKALADHPGLEGDLVVEWTIDPKGKVSRASVDAARSQIAEPTAVACVVEVIRRIPFSPSPGGYETTAHYPFNFHPRRTPRTTSP
jgi:hypothetical protein